MKQYKKITSALMSALILSTSCSTIVSDSSYPVTITSSPKNAHFSITNDDGIEIHTGRTPSTVSLKSGDGYFSKANYKIDFDKNGFEAKTSTLEANMDGWYWGNFLFGGILGLFVVDPITGAMWKMPKVASVNLNQVQTPNKPVTSIAKPTQKFAHITDTSINKVSSKKTTSHKELEENKAISRLKVLKTMFQNGLITETEFNEKRKSILVEL